MKKSVKILALAACAACTFTLSACGGCGGCAGATTYTITTSPNWLIRGGSADELDASSYLLASKEVATYSISSSGGANDVYSAEYSKDGSYTATLYAEEYDWNSPSIPQSLRVENKTGYVYVYETVLEQPGAFVMGGERHEFINKVTTKSCFLSAGNSLRPVYSLQDVECTTPNSLQPASLETSFVVMDGRYETFYSYDGVSAQTTYSAVITYPDSVSEISGTYTPSVATEYTLFDAASLPVALRSMTQSGTHVFDVYVPVNGLSARYQAAWGSASAITEDGWADVISVLDAATDSGYLIAGLNEDGERAYSVTPVTVSLVSAMTGPSSTYYFASVTDPDLNACRALPVRIDEVVPFNLGTITYTLNGISLIGK